MPFAISLLSFSAISMTFNLIDNDIVDINWDYQDNVAFALTGEKTRHPLKAIAINDRNYPTGQVLKWNVYNVNPEEEKHAEIYVYGKTSYLHTLSIGDVVITVSNEKGNVQKKMNATIFNKNTIVFNTVMKGSQSNIDSNIYYGQYDLLNNTKVCSTFNYNVSAITEHNNSSVKLISHSDNITVDENKKMVRISSGGTNKIEPAYLTFGFTNPDILETYTYNFNVVTNGINVYNYNDLLYCTNKSQFGEIVVLRKNLESSQNMANNPNSENTALFGNVVGEGYNFKNEVYKFETNYNREFIDQWNSFARTNPDYRPISSLVNVGIHVQKDFYGNGFTINMHNLTYPYSQFEYDGHIVPKLSDENVFRGPLAYYSLGDPNNMPLVTAYGQDNIGMYVEGDNITINDLQLKSCDFGNNLANMDYVGTTLEIYGSSNVTIKNSVIYNGKNVLRSFDSTGVLLDNCLLEHSRNFLLTTGSYDYMTISGNELYNFTLEGGGSKLATANNYLAPKADGDVAIENYIMGKNQKQTFEAMRSIQLALDNKRTHTFKGDITVKDTLFYMSGISSIAMESLFNGPFLFNASPSIVWEKLNNQGEEAKNLIPYIPTHVGGVSYPVTLTLAGKTRFYDYKTKNVLDMNGLVGQNISTILASLGLSVDISLDDIFPIKSILLEEAKKKNALYKEEVNSPIAFYGGGLNLSEIRYSDDFEYLEHLTDIFDVNFMEKYASGGAGGGLAGVLLKAVTIVSGFNPFKFALTTGGYLYGEAPKIQDLIDNQNK